MVLTIATLLFAQTVTISAGQQDSIRRDSLRAAARARRDSIEQAREERAPRRIPVTPELMRTAFGDAEARSLLQRARSARLEQDTTLTSYDATAYARISAGLGLRKFGRDRLLFRRETASRVRWDRDKGVWIDVLGARAAVPMVKDAELDLDDLDDELPIPYYPGRDALWVGQGMVRREVDDREIVHPLAEGSEAYYRYATGDSVTFQLPDGRRIRLRELRVEARQPKWNQIVGSFWFDESSAQLVRAAYRLSTPMDIVQVAAEEDGEDDIPRWLRPMTANIEGIVIEYGLHEGRWWLPRVQYATGGAQVSFARIPFKLEESFRYRSVNGIDTLPSFPAPPDSLADSTAADSTHQRRRRTVDEGDAMLSRRTRYGGLTIVTRMPKDSAALANSPELPPSIYDANDALFSQEDADRLMKELDFGLQARWNPQAPTLHLPPGDGLLRYNRVEGLSAGAMLTENFGRGYGGAAMLRLGVADLEPNGELAVSRGTGRDSVGLAAYRRLASANDWGDPFGVGPSLSAFLFARDQGVYYRTGGVELRGERIREGILTWRLFAEREWRANVGTQFSLPKAINGTRFIPNIVAERGDVAGAALRYNRTIGLDPAGLRSLFDLRLEGGAGDFDYGRGALDVTLTHPLLANLDGALTVSGGSSLGELPIQRDWFLGGAQTVRGHEIGTMFGDAYWLARAELGTSFVAARPVVFYDVGWAGARADFAHPGTPMQGAGIGASILDGLLRFDVAKGIKPNDGWRVEFYVEGRF